MTSPPYARLPLADLPEFSTLPRPPTEIRLWGELPSGPRIGIVGSRGASEEGLRSARRLARELAERGVCVVSGGARGIDAAAHEGALEAGGSTLVVAPLPWERAYPSEHRGLFERVLAAGGGYLTLAEDGATAVQSTFFRRNEALVALSTLLVVGECRFRSGARNAVGAAVAQRRPVFVLPSPYGHTQGRGSNLLLGRVARAVTSVEQLLGCLFEPAWPGAAESLALLDREAGLLEPPPPRRPRAPRSVSERSAGPRRVPSPPTFSDDAGGRVLRAIFEGATFADRVAEVTGLPPNEVAYEILNHTLGGRVREDERGLLQVVEFSAPTPERERG